MAGRDDKKQGDDKTRQDDTDDDKTRGAQDDTDDETSSKFHETVKFRQLKKRRADETITNLHTVELLYST